MPKPPFNKDGSPRKPCKRDPRPKPVRGCKHEWELVDISAIPGCVKCGGHLMYGEPGYAAAHIEARMKSARGSCPVKQWGSHHAV